MNSWAQVYFSGFTSCQQYTLLWKHPNKLGVQVKSPPRRWRSTYGTQHNPSPIERQIAVGANNPFFVDFFVQEMSQTLWEYIWSSNDKHRIYTASKDQRTIESVGQDGRKAEGREEGGGFKVCKGWAEEGERVMLAHLSCVIVFNIRLAKQSSSSNIEHAYTIQMQRKDTLTNNHHPNAQMETSRRGGRCWFWMAGWTRHKTRVLWQLIKLVKAPPWSSIDGTPPAFSTQQQPNGRILQWRWNFHNSK